MSVEKEVNKITTKIDKALMFVPIIRDIWALISGAILGIKTVLQDYDVDRARFLRDNGLADKEK